MPVANGELHKDMSTLTLAISESLHAALVKAANKEKEDDQCKAFRHGVSSRVGPFVRPSKSDSMTAQLVAAPLVVPLNEVAILGDGNGVPRVEALSP